MRVIVLEEGRGKKHIQSSFNFEPVQSSFCFSPPARDYSRTLGSDGILSRTVSCLCTKGQGSITHTFLLICFLLPPFTWRFPKPSFPINRVLQLNLARHNLVPFVSRNRTTKVPRELVVQPPVEIIPDSRLALHTTYKLRGCHIQWTQGYVDMSVIISAARCETQRVGMCVILSPMLKTVSV